MKIINLLLLLAMALSNTSAFGKNAKIAADLRTEGEGTVDVIVRFASEPSAKRQEKMRNHGGSLKSDFGETVNGGAYTVSRKGLEALANDPDVVSISPRS